MTRQWQQTRFKALVMPDAVYYQSIWAVRDLSRMEERLAELEERETLVGGKSVVSDQTSNFVMHSPTEDFGMEKAVLRERVDGIHAALDAVPEEYRSVILGNLILRTSVSEYPSKIWTYWKQKFLFLVAKNLSIM